MAEEGASSNPPTEQVWLFVILAIVLYGGVRAFLNSQANLSGGPPIMPAPATVVPPLLVPSTGATPLYESLVHWWGIWLPFSFFVSLIFLTGIIYCYFRIRQIHHAEAHAYDLASRPVIAGDVSRTKLRWDRILERVHSENPENWRLAIIDADIMLDELLSVLGYQGETMAEKMKKIERADFHTIDFAWEAHKVRNRLAHEGSDYHLTSDEARNIIDLYSKVFREFKYIE